MSEVEAEGEVERQRLRAERLIAVLGAVSAADLETLLDEELTQLVSALRQVSIEAEEKLRVRVG